MLRQVRKILAASCIVVSLCWGTAKGAADLDYPWPSGVIFIGEDCSLYPQANRGNSLDSLSVTVFTTRRSRAFPEHDLPAPVKVGRKLFALQPARPGVRPRLLVDAGKGALGSPSVSYDGRWVYFSMALDGEPFFHIYRITSDSALAESPPKPQRLTDGPFHDIDPAELPDGRIVFASTRIGVFEEYHSPPARALFVMNSDGSDIQPITHTIIFDNEPEVMADGRLIFIRSDNFFDRGKVETRLHAMRPDGTHGETAFGLDNAPEYGNRLRAFICGSPAPLPDGRVAFISEPGITVGRPGEPPQAWRQLRLPAGDVASLPDGRLLFTSAEADDYRQIQLINPDSGESVVVHDAPVPGLHSPVYLGPRRRPPILPNVINRDATSPAATGVLFCQDARRSQHTTAGWTHVRAIRVLAARGLTTRSSHSYIVHAGSEVIELGTVPLAPDGSFAVEVPADTPIAFQAIDAEGRAELNEMSWIYVRPGERRGCVGCHESRQAAPPPSAVITQALQVEPLKLLGSGNPHRFRGNNAAVTGLMELQFDRFREVAGINRHGQRPGAPENRTQNVQDLIAGTGSPDQSVRLSSAQRLALFRDSVAAGALAACLTDPYREVRTAAAVALAACGNRQSAPALLDALEDPDPLVAQAAAVALENLTGHAEPLDPFADRGDTSSRSRPWRAWFESNDWRQIEEGLIQQLSASDPDGVRRAAVALGHIGAEPARTALRAYVDRERHHNPFPQWRQTHRGDAARFNSLDDVNPRTLQAAVRALGQLRDQESTPLLAEIIAKHADPEAGNLFLVEAAAEALGRIGTPEAELALIRLLMDLDHYWRYNLWYGDHEALIACHASPPHYRIVEALDAIGATRLDQIVPHLIRLIPTDPDRALLFDNDDCEVLVARAIRRAGAESQVVETCLAILGDPDAARTPEIEQAINVIHGAWAGRPTPVIRAAQILSLVARDPAWEPRVRATFTRFTAEPTHIKRVFDTGIPVLHELPTKHWVCFYLARTLAYVGDTRSLPSLLTALGTPGEAASGYPDPLGPGVLFLHNDLTPCWRAAVAWALGRIGDRRAVPVLLDTIADLTNATDTRHAAAEALMRLAETRDLPTIRALARDYPEVSTRKTLLRTLDDLGGD